MDLDLKKFLKLDLNLKNFLKKENDVAFNIVIDLDDEMFEKVQERAKLINDCSMLNYTIQVFDTAVHISDSIESSLIGDNSVGMYSLYHTLGELENTYYSRYGRLRDITYAVYSFDPIMIKIKTRERFRDFVHYYVSDHIRCETGKELTDYNGLNVYVYLTFVPCKVYPIVKDEDKVNSETY